MPGKLILLPNFLDGGSSAHLPIALEDKLLELDGMIAETPKVARRLLSGKKLKVALQEFPIETLSEHTSQEELSSLLSPLKKGETWGLVSDAGLPCIADPGAALVALARREKIAIEALSGPSSIFLSLMLSGLGGQCFAFHGYLPRKEPELVAKIKELAQQSEKEGMTQLFIETPYRNEQLFKVLLEVLPNKTTLSVAIDLTKESEEVHVHKISEWKKRSIPELSKRPVIFSFINI